MADDALRTRVESARRARDRGVDGDARPDRQRALGPGLHDHAADLVAHLEGERHEGRKPRAAGVVGEHRMEVGAADATARDLHPSPRRTGKNRLWFLDERDRKLGVGEVELGDEHGLGK